MLNDAYRTAEDGMSHAMEHLRNDLRTLRTGKASLSVLDGVKVDYYGTPTPLNQVSNLSVVDATLITAAPWEPKMIQAIEKAIQNADIGISPSNDGHIVRLPIPALTEERRKGLVKKAKGFCETTKVSIRQARHEGRDQVDKLEKDKEISEDDKHRGHDNIQELHDQYIKEVEDILKHKEKEVMEV